MFRRLLVCCALVAAVACGGADPLVPSTAPLSGTWTLHTLNDAVLPYRLPDSPNGYPTTIAGASLAISGTDSGSYTEVIDAHVVTPARTIDTSLVYSGTWVLNGGSITFDGTTLHDVYQGSFTNNTIVKPVLFGYFGEYSR
jgi:hypothetical protein